MKEFKIIGFTSYRKKFGEIENTLAQKTAEGWEVVSMTVEDFWGRIFVLIQREK